MTSLMKQVCNIVAIFLTAPWWVTVRLSGTVGDNDYLFCACGQFFSLVPGRTGVFLRRAYYRMTLPKCGDDFSIEFLSWIAHRRSSIGKNVYVGANCILGTVEIEKDVLIGSHVNVLSGRNQHGFEETDVPLARQKGVFTMTRIGENSWIGNGCIVMADVGTMSVVGAGSVVVNSIPDNVVAVGSPARAIRQRELATPAESIVRAPLA
jgi:virginiamycin A acetyltransferase